jgi:hypothetical protein
MLIVVLPPAHIAAEDGVAVITGTGLTVTVICEVDVHPFPSVPVTVYVVVAAGVTETGDPGNDPGFQTYVVAPLALSEVEAPAQIGLDVAADETTGVGFTVTVITNEDVHVPLVPVTV